MILENVLKTFSTSRDKCDNDKEVDRMTVVHDKKIIAC